jgi:hypothetical protein
MSIVTVQGNAGGTGTLTVTSPNTNSNYTVTLPTATTTLVGTDATQTLTNKTLTSPTITGAVVSSMASSVITSGTAQASTSGTSIDFTSIPSWVKRITVMFQGVSVSSTSFFLLQIGSGSVTTSGYVSGAHATNNTDSTSTAGFVLSAGTQPAANTYSGAISIMLSSTNTYVSSGLLNSINTAAGQMSGGWIALGGALDRVRITTVGGTDTFDAGTINILYE